MRAALLVSLFGIAACGNHSVSKNTEALTCATGQTAVYTNRFASVGGSSGVATPSDATAGATSSAPNAAPATGDEAATTAMTSSCEAAMCPAGQVAVEIPPVPLTTGGGVGIDDAAPSSGASSGEEPSSPSSPPATTSPTVVCTDPPPACDTGKSPQFTIAGTWECTDCALVVTYGSAYGNERRCVGAPTIHCDGGEVPTWSYDNEKWECQPECDNGAYDQHTIDNQEVCVPC